MDKARFRLRAVLLAFGFVHILVFCAVISGELEGISGLLYADGRPVGGDFINLWTAARMVLSGQADQVYSVSAFKAYQATLTGGADIGLRLWAYPPHSLLLIWPFGFLSYYAALAAWSIFGLAVLFIGARRFGFDWLETAVLLVSPATILNLYYGQTGSFATGLVLLALAIYSDRGRIAPGAAALLTIKPQAGFLLPVLWLFEQRWRMILSTGLVVLLLGGMSLALFGIASWRDYLGDTLPALGALERNGSGPFLSMIPSAFIAMRIVTDNSTIALATHTAFAAAVGLVLLWRLWRINDSERRAALTLLATVLMTPYMHNYDLGLLLCGALLVARRPWVADSGSLLRELPIILAWFLPQLVVFLNIMGLPVSPLLILPLLFMA